MIKNSKNKKPVVIGFIGNAMLEDICKKYDIELLLDYSDCTRFSYKQIQKSIKKHFKKYKFCYSGDFHQRYGLPVVALEDLNHIYIDFKTYREWGSFMAEIYREKGEMAYMNHYMDRSPIDHHPSKLDNPSNLKEIVDALIHRLTHFQNECLKDRLGGIALINHFNADEDKMKIYDDCVKDFFYSKE